MSTSRFHESGSLVAAKGASGVFPVRIITEGKGSSATYTAEVLKTYAEAFNNSPSYMNHPLDMNKPWDRDVTTIAGKIISEVRYEEKDGIAALYADLEVDPRWVDFVERYADVIGMSVYIEGTSVERDGQVFAESFNGSDPYKSVDFVVAAGRGGRVERAMESFRAIESSVGQPDGKPNTNQVSGTEKEKMDKETIDAINTAVAEALKPMNTFIAEFNKGKTEELQANVDAAAVDTQVAERLTAYKEKEKLIESAGLFPSQVEAIKAEAIKGADVAPLIEAAKKVVAEAKGAGSGTQTVETVRVGESANAEEDYSMPGVRFN